MDATIIGIAVADGMLKDDDNRLRIYVVPDTSWATEAEWREYLTAHMASDASRKSIIKHRWFGRSGVRFSAFERLARMGYGSLADIAPDDATIVANAARQHEFEATVEAAVASIEMLPVGREYGRETRLGIPFSGRFWTTRYLSTHAEIIEWSRQCLVGESR